jgi:hypothetical protein
VHLLEGVFRGDNRWEGAALFVGTAHSLTASLTFNTHTEARIDLSCVCANACVRACLPRRHPLAAGRVWSTSPEIRHGRRRTSRECMHFLTIHRERVRERDRGMHLLLVTPTTALSWRASTSPTAAGASEAALIFNADLLGFLRARKPKLYCRCRADTLCTQLLHFR